MLTLCLLNKYLYMLAQRPKKDDVIFLKQIPLHPRDRLKKKVKTLKHPRDRLKDKELQVARDNVSALVEEKFSFLTEKFLNKIVLFDISKVENLPTDNNKFYITHKPGTKAFLLRREDEK